MKRFLLNKYQSLVDSLSNAKHYVQGKYEAVNALFSNIKQGVQHKYQIVKAIPSNIKTSVQNKYQSLKESISSKKRFVVSQYQRFRDSRFVGVMNSTLRFLRRYGLPVSSSILLTAIMSNLKMPWYMKALQNIGDPGAASFVLGSSILIPSLVGTKIFRASKEVYQKYLEKQQAFIQPASPALALPELPQPELGQPERPVPALELPELRQAESEQPERPAPVQVALPEVQQQRQDPLAVPPSAVILPLRSTLKRSASSYQLDDIRVKKESKAIKKEEVHEPASVATGSSSSRANKRTRPALPALAPDADSNKRRCSSRINK